MSTEKTARSHGYTDIFRLMLFIRKQERKPRQRNARGSWAAITRFGHTLIASMQLLPQTTKRTFRLSFRKLPERSVSTRANLILASQAVNTTNTFKKIS